MATKKLNLTFGPGTLEVLPAIKGKRAVIVDRALSTRVADVGDANMTLGAINETARLFAAAPGLFSVAKALSRVPVNACPWGCDDRGHREECVVVSARRAIAKARSAR